MKPINQVINEIEIINQQIEKIERENNIHLYGKIYPSDVKNKIIYQYKYKFSDENNGVNIDKLNISKEDKDKIINEVNTYDDFKKIVSKYIGDSKKTKLKQMNLSISDSIYDTEIKKIQKQTGDKGFNVYDYRKNVDINQIRNLLLTKTKKYVPADIGFSTFSYERMRELEDVIRITTGLEINYQDMSRGFNTSIAQYNNQLNSIHSMISFKAFKNGNIRIAINDDRLHDNFRSYFIENEMDLIRKIRSR